MKIILNNVSYIRNKEIILENINLVLEENFYTLIGPNGSGKTTLLSIITGLEWPTVGSSKIEFENSSFLTAHKKQFFGNFFPKIVNWFETYHSEISILETICTGFYDQIGYYTEATKEQKEIARSLLKQYIPSVSEKYYNKKFIYLSTGEKYRTLLLRSIIKKPKILILDEPFDGLDIKGRIEFEKFISEISKQISFIIIVLHRIEEIPSFVKKAILLKEGKVFYFDDIDKALTSLNFSKLYDMDLIIKKINNRFYAIINEFS
ncbi:MAG: ABC transporter ATP-binding protein [Leptospiraceae bacterium]|nr:MAG: ABC transporter ATP-binding protein [Leptospiraceae bacterium]